MTDYDFSDPHVAIIQCYFSHQVAKAIYELREDHRLKLHLDYAFMRQYGVYAGTHVVCVAVYEETIREVFTKYGIEISTVSTYDRGSS